MSAAASTEKRPWRYYLQRNILVILLLGVSAGLPFPLVYSTLTAWLNDAGLQKSTISTFAWVGFAFSFKFLWAPLVDRLSVPILTRWLGRRRGWLLFAQLLIAASLCLLSTISPVTHIEMFALVAIAVALASATQDIVIDAYRIECADVEMQGVLAAAYQYGYRIALLISMAAAIGLSDFMTWDTIYLIMSAFMLIGIVTTLACREPKLPPIEAVDSQLPAADRAVQWLRIAVAEPFVDFIKRYGVFSVVLLSFALLYRLSDYVLGILANPFYQDIGYTGMQIATVAKAYGMWVSLVAIGLGGIGVLRYGVGRCLVIATILIASTNLFFAAMVLVGPEVWMLAVTITADNFAQGFSGTVLIAFLSSLVNPKFTATQYALLSSFMSLLGKFTAGYSGDVQESLGWLGFFLYAAALGIPAIILAFVVARRHDSLMKQQ